MARPPGQPPQPGHRLPLGALCFYYKAGAPRHKLYFYYYQRASYTVPQIGDWIELGTPYMFRMKAEPLDPDIALFMQGLAGERSRARGVDAFRRHTDR